MERLRVMIVDDHPLFREGVRNALEANKDIEVVGDVANGQSAVHMAETLVPNIMLVDINLPGLSGLEVTRAVRRAQPHIAVIILSDREDDEQLFDAARVGASGWLSKDSSGSDLLDAIRTVGEGFYPINDTILSRPMVASKLLNQFRTLAFAESEREESVFAPLTGREVEILDCIARGNSNKEAAVALTISDQTVKNHMTSILRKLSVNDRTQAVVYAARHGWIKFQSMSENGDNLGQVGVSMRIPTGQRLYS
jgi:DNA-binding NarL/FixJ family response regulator